MGDRTTIDVICPKCNKTIEMYDAPSCLDHTCVCEYCGYTDGLDYYEEMKMCENSDIGESDLPNRYYVIHLLTREKAEEMGLVSLCPKCNKDMSQPEKKEYGQCYSCLDDTEQA